MELSLHEPSPFLVEIDNKELQQSHQPLLIEALLLQLQAVFLPSVHLFSISSERRVVGLQYSPFIELVFFFAIDFTTIYQSVSLSKWNLNSIIHSYEYLHLFSA